MATETLKATCPTCRSRLSVPETALGKRGRCRVCGHVFPIALDVPAALGAAAPAPARRESAPDASAATTVQGLALRPVEDEVLDWLNDGPPVPGAQEPKRLAGARPAGMDGPGPGTSPAGRGPGAGDQPRRYSVQLGHLDDMGAFFLFEPALLAEEDFRAACPQQCIVCGRAEHLAVYVLPWPSKQRERQELRARDSYHKSARDLASLGAPSGRELLAILPPIESLPEPYCQPFPYYVCHTCSPVGAVVTDVRQGAGGREICELGIANLAQAERFVAAVCGTQCAVHRQIAEAVGLRDGDHWRALPLAVRSRIGQWYKPLEGEHFVRYYPDSEYAKAEAGLAGLVLTNRRLVVRKLDLNRALPLHQPLAIRTSRRGGHLQLDLTSTGVPPASLMLAPHQAEELHAQLRLQGCRTQWEA